MPSVAWYTGSYAGRLLQFNPQSVGSRDAAPVRENPSDRDDGSLGHQDSLDLIVAQMRSLGRARHQRTLQSQQLGAMDAEAACPLGP